MSSIRATFTAGVVIAAVLASICSPPAAADDPPFVGWSALAPSLTSQFDPNSDNLCNRGSIRCVEATIREMQRRFDPEAASCSHDAIFALTYLRTTQEYYRTVANDPAFFSDTPFVNHEDAVFASYYFDAYDAWHGGDRSHVPGAWAAAFDAAARRTVSGTGDLLLGVSAHVNRDLPFALAAIGLVKPDGTSRKPDHDKVDQILNRVYGPVLSELARRFDPSVSNAIFDGSTLDDAALLQIVVGWREEAWRNAERLVTAPTPADRSAVAASIEDAATLEAKTIIAQTSYAPPVTSTAARDAYCAVHHADP
jgi:hypothetical protein